MGNSLKSIKSQSLIAAHASRMTKDRALYLKVRSCEIKKAYGSESDARVGLAPDQKVYSCQSCGQWHRAHTHGKELLNYVRSVRRNPKSHRPKKRQPIHVAISDAHLPPAIRRRFKDAVFVERISSSKTVWKIKQAGEERLVVYSSSTKEYDDFAIKTQ